MDSTIEPSMEKTNVKDTLERCNTINLKQGTQDETDFVVGNDVTLWELYNIRTTNELTIAGTKVSYQLVHRKLNKDMVTPLIVFPGYSEKSICWTIGRMNKFINEYPKIFNQYSDVYIFNFEKSKPIQEKAVPSEISREDFDNQLVQHVDLICRMIYKKHNNEQFVILGRSAGGGICIRLACMDSTDPENPKSFNKKIRAMYLMAPGYKKSGIKDTLLNTNIDIPIFLAYVNQDTRASSKEIYQMRTDFLESNYPRFEYIELDNFSPLQKQGDNFNHRIWYHLVEKLDMAKYHNEEYFTKTLRKMKDKYL